MLLIWIPLIWVVSVALAVALCRSAARCEDTPVKGPSARRAPAAFAARRLGAGAQPGSYRTAPPPAAHRPRRSAEFELRDIRGDGASPAPEVRRVRRPQERSRRMRPRRARCLGS